MSVYNLTVVIEKGEDGNFLALCPALQGCYADGETAAEALETIKGVIKMHIEDRLENGEYIPEEIYSSQLKIAV
jgi:predicted RNase H-like HicB family nuclease